MNNQQKLQHAMQFAMTNRPPAGGFPFLAECLRKAGVTKNIWSLPSTQSIYIMKGESLVQQGTPLLSGMTTIPTFNEDSLITALRLDQEGKGTFPEFLLASWKAGVIEYEVDFEKHYVEYRGANGELYKEEYLPVEVFGLEF